MFVFSLKADKPKLILILCAVVVILIAIVMLIKNGDKPVVNDGGVSLKASNETERIAFLSQFGWKINEDPSEVTEVIIPSEFNDTYSAYNALQQKQNLDLEPYKGLRVKKWVYEVKNYPGYAAESGCIMATILVYNGLVIGGDVSSIELDGFTRGFNFPEEAKSTTNITKQMSSTSATTVASQLQAAE